MAKRERPTVERRVDGFFYGLFMDRDVLGERQVVPGNPRRASLDGYALRIGQRATLVPAPGARTYGMLFALTHDELARLYGDAGLEDYRPEAVLVELMTGGRLPALCYTLQQPPRPGESNAAYAAQLRAALERLGFPATYVASVS